jgi:hypothetical protein
VKIAIQQPTYLPWQGYFALIDYVDEFIFLENVQFSKQSWQQRNKIVFNEKENYLTIPIKSRGKSDQRIYEVEIDNFNRIKKKHLATIQNAYSKSDYFNFYFHDLKEIYQNDYKKLSDLNKDLIKYFCKVLKIETSYSEDRIFSFTSKRLDYLQDICVNKNCSNYISTLGSKKYIGNLNYFPNTNIKIEYYDFKNNVYQQKTKNFIPRLSILDLLFNVGPTSLEYLRSNFFINKFKNF